MCCAVVPLRRCKGLKAEGHQDTEQTTSHGFDPELHQGTQQPVIGSNNQIDQKRQDGQKATGTRAEGHHVTEQTELHGFDPELPQDT